MSAKTDKDKSKVEEKRPILTPPKMPDYTRSRLRRAFFMGRVILYTSCVFVLGILALMFIATVDDTIAVQGKVKPRKDVEVRALDPGVLLEVYVQPEDVVKVGEILAKYDDKVFRDELATCKEEQAQNDADLAAGDARIAKLQADPLPEKLKFADEERKIAETRLAAARKEFERSSDLFKKGVLSQAAFDDSKNKYETAKSEVEIAASKDKIVNQGLAQAIIAEAKAERERVVRKGESLKEKEKRILEKLDRALLRAPVGGQIILADKGGGELVKAGIHVQPGESLFVIATGSEREVHLWVPEDKIGKVAKGHPVRIRSSAFDYQKYGEALGHVADVSLYATDHDGKKEFWVRAVVDESPVELPFGSSVSAFIVIGRKTLMEIYILDRE